MRRKSIAVCREYISRDEFAEKFSHAELDERGIFVRLIVAIPRKRGDFSAKAVARFTELHRNTRNYREVS